MNDAVQPEKYYIRCDYLEKELQKLHCSTQILSEWKQEGLLLCDRGSLWCRRVIDPENTGDKAAVYVLAAMNSMEDPLSDVEIDEGFDANEEPQLLEEAQSDENCLTILMRMKKKRNPSTLTPMIPNGILKTIPLTRMRMANQRKTQTASISQPAISGRIVFDDNELTMI